MKRNAFDQSAETRKAEHYISKLKLKLEQTARRYTWQFSRQNSRHFGRIVGSRINYVHVPTLFWFELFILC